MSMNNSKKIVSTILSLLMTFSISTSVYAEEGTEMTNTETSSTASNDSIPTEDANSSVDSTDSSSTADSQVVEEIIDENESTPQVYVDAYEEAHEEEQVNIQYKELSKSVTSKTSSISWGSIANADGYEIVAINDDGQETVINEVYSNKFILTDDIKKEIFSTGFTEIYVRAFNVVAPSGYTESTKKYLENGYKISIFARPDNFTEDVKASATNTKATLTWAAANNANYYRIYNMSSNDTPLLKKFYSTSSSVSTTITVKSGSIYTFKIVPVRRVDYNGGYKYFEASNYKTVTFTTKPSQVKNLKVNLSSNTATLSWDSTRCSNYVIQRKTGNGVYVTLKTVSDSTKTYTDKNLKSGESYSYRVRAYKISNTGNKVYGSYSNIATITTNPAKTVFNSNNTGLYNVYPSWEKVSGVDGYEISIYNNGKWNTVKTTGTKKNFNGLQSHKSYNVRIRTYKKINGKTYYSEYTTKTYWTDSKLKSDYSFYIYSSKNTVSKVLKTMSAGSIVQQKGTPTNEWICVYIPGTNKSQIGYVVNKGLHYYADLNLTTINQNSYAGGTIAPLGCEETSLASVLKNQYGFNVTKNHLIDNYLPMGAFDSNGKVYVDPNYAFWGSPYHRYEKDGNGYGVYAPVIAQSAYQYLRDQKQTDNYQINLHTDYYTGNNPNNLKFDPSKLQLGTTSISGGLTLQQIRDELDKGHNVIVWYDVTGNPYVSKTVTLTKGGKYTNPGSGTYTFKWYAHQHTAVITGYDNALSQFKIANVWNSNSYSYTGSTTYISYSSFENRYAKLGRQSVVIYKK